MLLQMMNVPNSEVRKRYSRSQVRSKRSPASCRRARWSMCDSSSGFGGLEATMQLLGSVNPRDRYHSAAATCDSQRSTTSSTAVRRRCDCTSRPYLRFTVMYPTVSPMCSRGANFPFLHIQETDGNSCSKSGSRRIEPSTNGQIPRSREAARPYVVATSGVYEFKKNESEWLIACESPTTGLLDAQRTNVLRRNLFAEATE